MSTVIKQLKEDLSLERKINSSLLEEFSAIIRERDMLKDRNKNLVKVNEELTEKLEEYKQLYDYARQDMDTIMVAGTLYHNKRENDLIDKNKELVKKNNDLRKNLEEALRHVDREKEKIIKLEQENSYCRRQVRHVETAMKDLITKLEAEKR